MGTDELVRLASLLQEQREELLKGWRIQARALPSARNLDIATLNDHIPVLLEELIVQLRANSKQSIPEQLALGSSTAHGLQRLKDDFEIEEVVAEYNIFRGCVHDLAGANGINLQGEPFYVLNRVLDHAIGLALQTYSTQLALQVQQRREEYLAFVAHDLRTPLNAIALAGKVLENSLGVGAANQEMTLMLTSLSRNVKHLERLVSQVLEENSNLEAEIGLKLQRRCFDLWPLVENLIHDLHPVAGTDSTKLVNEVPIDLQVYADASLLRRILQNLIANAIRYTPRGKISISARCDAAKGIECAVTDDGSGIAPEFLGKVFEKGETDPLSGGIGLGLAIVRTFTEAHGGLVEVESQEGVGSVFRFTLPLEKSLIARA